MKKVQTTPLPFTKTGLVCSGGATKAAAFHVGVCLALRDKGFSFVGGRLDNPPAINSLPYPRPRYHPYQIATYVGSSAGSFIATLLASGIPIESVINAFVDGEEFKAPGNHPPIPKLQYKDILSIHWPRPTSILKSFQKSSILGKTLESMVLKNLRLPGIFSTRNLSRYLEQNILPTPYFHELKADLFVVGTQLDHSRKIVFGRFGTEKTYDPYCQYASNAVISEAVGASMSLPPVFAPYLVHHEGHGTRYYIDGEIRETLSTHVAKENGCDLIICSYTHQPYHYRDDIGSLFHFGLSAIVIQALYQAIEQKVYGARKAHENKVATFETVRNFCKRKKYPEEDIEELVDELREKLDFHEKLNYVFIHPEAKDTEMFFGDHFTLNSEALKTVANIGYKRAMAELRKYDLRPQA
ncbi:MAG: patatin-like phospholipase family protein [Deltaproteobacteria bacterium]|nr:patatin-like phospholipase family protein [Deltaproteobacteria bacterium]MBI3295981.1 patatin-like phospholipase family protein [Deltaproteobacteria bacterium]